MVGLAVASTLAAGVWWHFDVLEISDDERGAYDDGLKKFTGNPKPPVSWLPFGKVSRSKNIVIVAIDDATFAEVARRPSWTQRYGNWPYDRKVWADAFRYLHRAGAKAIVFDAVMNEPNGDGTGDLALSQAVDELGIPLYLGFATVATAKPLPKVESPLNRGAPKPKPAEAPAPSAPAAGGGDEEFPSDDFPEEPSPEEKKKAQAEAEAKRLELAAKAYAIPVRVEGGLELPPFESEPERDEKGALTGHELMTFPIPAIEGLLQVVAGFGAVTHEPDEDGKMRRTRFVYGDGQNTYATLPVAVAADLYGADEVVLSPGKLQLGSHTVHINPDGSAEIDYGGVLKDRFRTIPLHSVLDRWVTCQAELEKVELGPDAVRCPNGRPEEDPEGAVFKDAIVMVGGFAVGTADVKATPLEQATPAVIKQAATLEGLIENRFIVEAPFAVSLVFAFFVALFSVALVLVVRNTFVDIGWPVLLYVGFFVVTGSFLVATKVHLLSAMPGLAGTLGSVLAATWERVFARKERERLKEQFQHFMEPDLVEEMVEQARLPSLEGEYLTVTAFFSDIRGFSTFSERYRDDPKGLMNILNRYLSTVTPKLTDEGACIDKYIGDAVVALFGAPVQHEDHALRACRGALAVQEAIAKLRTEFRDEGKPDVYTRIGLNTDRMMVGNIGSEQLLDYTAIGDGMNLAARLEGANKEFGTLIMLGPGTYQAVKHQTVTRELDSIRVAGKSLAVSVYELVGLAGMVSTKKHELLERYAQALALYRSRRFADAEAQLAYALELDPEDGPSIRLRTMCRSLQLEPPGMEWEPVSELSK